MSRPTLRQRRYCSSTSAAVIRMAALSFGFCSIRLFRQSLGGHAVLQCIRCPSGTIARHEPLPVVQRIGMDLDNGEQVAQAVEDRVHVAGRMGDRLLCG